jgi:hypothetical protein
MTMTVLPSSEKVQTLDGQLTVNFATDFAEKNEAGRKVEPV